MRVPAGASFSARRAASLRLSRLRSHDATEQPPAASCSTSSRPIPVPPPVTTARRPAKSTCVPPCSGETLGELHAIEQIRLLRREFLFGDDAALAQLVELLDLLGDRQALLLCRRLTAAAVHAVGVRLHLPVDLVLH